MERQLALQLDVAKLPQTRKLNGKWTDKLTSAVEHAANWRTLYIGEMTRQHCVARKMRILEEENIKLKIEIQTFKN
jgi:hypothetical protein